MIILYLLLAASALVFSQDVYLTDDNWPVDVRRRNVAPLRQSHRRWFGINDDFGSIGINYRKSKDIRNDVIDRTFELTEAQIREAQIAEDKEKLEQLHSEMRWLTVDTEEGIGI